MMSESQVQQLIPVGWTILVMGISLATVVILWLWFGQIAPTYSSDTLIHQQKTLRQDYGLSPQPVITDPKALLTPPSLRDDGNLDNFSKILQIAVHRCSSMFVITVQGKAFYQKIPQSDESEYVTS